MSVAYIGRSSRTEKPRKIKIGTEVAHVTCDSDTNFKGQKVKGQLVQQVIDCRQRQTGLVGCKCIHTHERINAEL